MEPLIFSCFHQLYMKYGTVCLHCYELLNVWPAEEQPVTLFGANTSLTAEEQLLHYPYRYFQTCENCSFSPAEQWIDWEQSHCNKFVFTNDTLVHQLSALTPEKLKYEYTRVVPLCFLRFVLRGAVFRPYLRNLMQQTRFTNFGNEYVERQGEKHYCFQVVYGFFQQIMDTDGVPEEDKHLARFVQLNLFPEGLPTCDAANNPERHRDPFYMLSLQQSSLEQSIEE